MIPSTIYFLLFTFVLSIKALPVIQIQQKSFQHDSIEEHKFVEKVPSSLYIENYYRLEKLNDYYYTIVNQVVESTLNEILETAPETFTTIHELQIVGREYCSTSVDLFMQVLEQELFRQVKNSLLVSVRPLITTLFYENTTTTTNQIKLNAMMSQELGNLLNPQRVSLDIIHKVYPKETFSIINYFRLLFDKTWSKTMHHKKNELFALEAWLRSWLMDIEFMLKDEFDSNLSALLL